MEKEIKISEAWDKRHTDRKKNYGVHGCEMRFYLKGELGIVQFVLFTNWQLPHVMQESLSKPINSKIEIECRFLPYPADLGYHSHKPMYEGQTSQKCDLLGGECYYDGSGLMAEEVFKIMLDKGSEGVWGRLEEYYISRFGELK